MLEIVSFISGCVFTLLLSILCMWLAGKLYTYKEEVKGIKPTPLPSPAGGRVIRPKTIAQKELEQDEEYQEMLKLLNQE